MSVRENLSNGIQGLNSLLGQLSELLE